MSEQARTPGVSPAEEKAGEHEWFQFHGLPCCKRCGIVQRRDGKNKACTGVLPKITLRLRQSESAPGER